LEVIAMLVAQGLVKQYGSHRALDGFDLTVEQGEIAGQRDVNVIRPTSASTAVRAVMFATRSRSARAVTSATRSMIALSLAAAGMGIGP
jgi:ABC-type branched-subunit amino acid transport system ATPase component